MILAPWTSGFISELNRFQDDPRFHGYTCGMNSNHSLLVATVAGWICKDCDYTQNWAHGWEWYD